MSGKNTSEKCFRQYWNGKGDAAAWTFRHRYCFFHSFRVLFKDGRVSRHRDGSRIPGSARLRNPRRLDATLIKPNTLVPRWSMFFHGIIRLAGTMTWDSTATTLFLMRFIVRGCPPSLDCIALGTVCRLHECKKLHRLRPLSPTKDDTRAFLVSSSSRSFSPVARLKSSDLFAGPDSTRRRPRRSTRKSPLRDSSSPDETKPAQRGRNLADGTRVSRAISLEHYAKPAVERRGGSLERCGPT